MGRGLDGFFDSRCGDCAVLKDRGGLSPFSGGLGEGETPLPIPNRAVKPLSADGTWLARAWESRTPPVYLKRTGRPQGGPSSLAKARSHTARPASQTRPNQAAARGRSTRLHAARDI